VDLFDFRIAPEFSSWSILRNLESNLWYPDDYSCDAALLRKAESHIRRYSRDRGKSTWITFTHPCYHMMSPVRERKGEDLYKARLEALLLDMDLRETAELVLFEDLHHYCAGTWNWLKAGVVDRVILTQYDSGNLLHPEQLDMTKRFISSGMFNGLCFFDSLCQLKGAEVTILRDLVLEEPTGQMLYPTEIIVPYGMQPGYTRSDRLDALFRA